MDKAGTKPSDIDLLIYCSVSKGVMEPGQSFVVANRHNIKNAICFDISEACNGFVRALQVISGLMNQGFVRRAMVVTGEFWMQEKFPVIKNFSPNQLSDFAWCFPAYTFGEMAAAMIVEKDPNADDWIFETATNTDGIKHCVMTEKWNKEFNGDSYEFSNIDERFICYGRELHEEGKKLGLPMVEKLIKKSNIKGNELIITHSSSKYSWDEMLDESVLSKHERYMAFPKYGNIVTATMPASLYEIGRSDKRFIYLCGAAGISVLGLVAKY